MIGRSGPFGNRRPQAPVTLVEIHEAHLTYALPCLVAPESQSNVPVPFIMLFRSLRKSPDH